MKTYEKKIVFREIRNFSETIAAVTYFIKQNLKILLKSTAFIALPIVMLGFLGMGVASMGLVEGAANDNIEGLMGSLGLFYATMFVMWLGLILVMGCVYEYIILYIKRVDFQNITVAEISQNVLKHIGLYISTTFLIAISFGVLFFFVLVFLGMFIFIHELLILFSVIAILVSLSYIAVALSNIYMIRIVERRAFFDAFGRCFELLSGHFLSTLGLYFVVSLISFSLLGLLPMIMQGTSLFLAETLMFEMPIFLYAFQIVYSIFYVGYNIIYGVAIGFRYFTLVEAKEGIGMLRKVRKIGQHLQISENPAT